MIDRVTVMHDSINPDKIDLLDDRILIEKIQKDKTPGGLHIVGAVRTEHCYGKVLRVGKGITAHQDGKLYPIDIKPGDTILSMDYVGDKLQHMQDQRKFVVIRDHAVWGKVKLGKNLELLDVEPYSSRVLVRIIDHNKTKWGMLLPSTHQTRGYSMAQVVKVGPGWRDLKTGYLYPMTVKPGDYVCMTRYAGTIVKLESDELRMIEERPYAEGDKQPDIMFIDEDFKEIERYD
jgi:chaperonin GroES